MPPPPGSRASTGDVTLNAEKSVAASARLSVAAKLPNHRRKYANSTDIRDATCRCTPAENSQLYGRTPYPFITAWSTVTLGVGLPKFRSDMAKQRSPPMARKFWSAGLVRSQSAAKLRLPSVQLRVTKFASRLTGASASPYTPCTPCAI